MEGQLINWIINLVVGAIGGNAAGALLKDLSLGTLGNTLVGLLGGGLGSQILGGLLGGDLVGAIAGSGVGGAVLLAIVGFIKKALVKT